MSWIIAALIAVTVVAFVWLVVAMFKDPMRRIYQAVDPIDEEGDK